MLSPADLLDLSPDQVRESARMLEKQAKRLLAMADAMEAADSDSEKKSLSFVMATAPSRAAQKSADGAPTSKRPAIVALLAESGKPLAPADVHRILVERGEVEQGADPSTTRMTLRRMAKKEEIVRVSDGYVLPSDVATSPQTLLNEGGTA